MCLRTRLTVYFSVSEDVVSVYFSVSEDVVFVYFSVSEYDVLYISVYLRMTWMRWRPRRLTASYS